MNNHALTKLFRPRSVAIVGAGERSIWTKTVLRSIEGVGFDGAVHLINRSGTPVFGRPTAPSCAAVGAPIDLALLLVSAANLATVFDDLAAAGIANAIIVSSGFGETGEDGARLQASLAAKAQQLGITVLGPNCIGFANFPAGAAVWTGTLRLPPLKGDIAIVSQSGAVANAVSNFAYRQGIGLSMMVSTGNEMNFGVTEAIAYLVDDPATQVICAFMEEVRHPKGFRAAAERAVATGKPLVVIKLGRSEITAEGARSHTGSIVGNDAVFDALCTQYGATRVGSVEEMVVTADVMSKVRTVRSPGVGWMSISGGLCGLSSDLASDAGVELPAFQAATSAALRKALPDLAVVHNPLDLIGASLDSPKTTEEVVKIVGSDPGVGLTAYVLEVPIGEEDRNPISLSTLASIGRASKESPTPTLVVATTSKLVSPYGRGLIEQEGVLYVSGGIELGLPAIGRMMRWQQHRARKRSAMASAEGAARYSGPVPHSEFEAQNYLAGFGVPVVPTIFARNADEAAGAARQAGGRIAMKIASPDILHKSDVGGVLLDLEADSIPAAYAAMMAAVAAKQPSARLDGVLISPMRRGGVELLVGIVMDPVWGPVMTIGSGGVLTEIFNDVSLRLLPVSTEDVGAMLAELRGSALLRGYRGAEPADLTKLAAVIVRIGAAALALGERLEALEINPLCVSGDRIEALDALILAHEKAG